MYELGRFGKNTELATMAALEQHLRTGWGAVAVGGVDIASFWLSALQWQRAEVVCRVGVLYETTFCSACDSLSCRRWVHPRAKNVAATRPARCLAS